MQIAKVALLHLWPGLYLDVLIGADEISLAKKGAHAIPEGMLENEPHGIPVISGALARFVCKVEQRYDGGDHVIFVGLVEEFTHVHEGRPLLFHRGAFRSLADLKEA